MRGLWRWGGLRKERRMGKLGKLDKLGKPGPLGGRVRRSASFRCSPTTPMNGGVCEAR